MATFQQYVDMLQKLFPVGAAWTADRTSKVHALREALAVELARVDARADVAIAEADPRTSTELLTDWERVTDTPNTACTSQLGTLQARRDAVAARLATLGGQSRAYFIQLARSVGFEVTITEFGAFEVGDYVGEDLTDVDWQFAWRVNAPAETVRFFRVGESSVGEELSTWGNDLLECTLSRVKPAHTVLQFGYGG